MVKMRDGEGEDERWRWMVKMRDGDGEDERWRW